MQLHTPFYITIYRKLQHNVLKWSKNTPHEDGLHSSQGQTSLLTRTGFTPHEGRLRSSRGWSSVVPRTKAKVPGTLGPVLGTTKMFYFLEM